MSPEDKARIDALSREDMARMWRFAPTGERLMQGAAGKYFGERFSALGGFSPEISKRIGWR